ncbi:TetR/AcrR family transcriptional regulator [Brevibacterium salitolerans]|uniref:HTH tetR-type domain-containing protein n=1 Tax=Brevibacterium salitolerans TaxID=1403566 RepID=A0ABP5IMC0_9MICO
MVKATLRERAVRAYAELLVEQGQRAATLGAVAQRISSSKGGVLHHFASMQVLGAALIAWFTDLAARDAERMREAPEGPVLFHLRTSADEDPELKLALLAVTRLAMSHDAAARQALKSAHERWGDVLAETVADPMAVRAILLVATGLSASADVGVDLISGVEALTDLRDWLIADD